MAGDWIKMRMDLPEDPAVFKIATLLNTDRHSIIGRLYAFWSWADKHAVDGRVDGASSQVVDAVVQLDGFAAALEAVKWLKAGDDFLLIPNHERHNGESAKERSLKNQRQSRWRNKSRDSDATPSTAPSTREEKRREEVKALPTIVGSPSAQQLLPSNIPYKEIVSLFNELMGKLPMVRELTQKRRGLIRSAWQAGKRRQSLEFWKRYFEECAEDDFLNGTGPYKPPHETWRPSFDFLMRSDQVTKVYERAMHEGGR